MARISMTNGHTVQTVDSLTPGQVLTACEVASVRDEAALEADAWQLAIDAQLRRLGLSDPNNGRSAMVARIEDDGAVLADVDDWNEPMDPEELCAILEAIDAEQSAEDIREELASELQAQ